MLERLDIVENQIYIPYKTLALNLPSPIWHGPKNPPEVIKIFQRDMSFKGVDCSLFAFAEIQTPANPKSPLGKSRLWIDYDESGITVVEAPVTLTLSVPSLDRIQLMTISNYYMEFIFPKVSYFMPFNNGEENLIDEIVEAMGREKRQEMEITTSTFMNDAWEEETVVFPYEGSILAQGIKFRVAKFYDQDKEEIPDPAPLLDERRLVFV